MANETLKVIISAQDQATGAIRRIAESLKDLKGTAILAGAALGALTLKKSIDAFTDFQSALKQSVAIMGDVSAEMEKALGKKALEISNSLAVSQEEVARAYYYLASAGLSAKEVMESVTDVAKLAVAAHMDMAEATDIAVNTMKAFGYEAKDLSKINDILIATVTKSNTNLAQLGEAMKYVAPFAKQVGWELSEVSAAIGLLADRGIKGSQAGTYLRQAIAQLVDPTDSAKEAIERLGLKVEDLNPETHSLTEILQKLSEAGATTSDIMQIFGVRAGSAMAVLMQVGAPALEDFNNKLKESSGITDEVMAKQQEAFGEQFKILKNNLTSIAITIGSVVVPALNSLLNPLLELLQAFNSLPEPIQKTAGAIIALGSALMVVLGVVKVVSGVAGFLGLSGAISSIAGAVSGVLPALGALAGAISLPVLAIGALIAAIGLLVFNVGGARDKLKEYLGTIKDAFVWAFNTIEEKMVNFASDMYNAALNIGRSILNGIKDGLSNIWNIIKETLTNPINQAIDWIKEKLKIGSPSKVFEEIGQSIVEGYGAGLKSIQKIKPVLPALQVKPMPTPAQAGGGQANIVIRLEGVAIREDKDIDKLAEEIEKRIGRKLRW